MVAPWVADEMSTVDLGDKRLNERLKTVLDQFAARPRASIPAACGGRNELTAAYRMFNNEKATFERVLRPHVDATEVRVAAQEVVITVSDTTELDLTRPEKQVIDAGPLDHGARVGALLHLTAAFTPDGTPQGPVEAVAWARAEDQPTSSAMSRAERQATPFEDKESHRWRDSLEASRELAGRCPTTRIVWVADSEADIFEVIGAGMEEPRPTNFDWIVRACQDRSVVCETAKSYLRETVMATPVLFGKTIQVRARKAKVGCETRGRRQPRKPRKAEMEVRAARVTLRGPYRPGGKLADVTVNVVIVSEVNPPADDVAVEWILITSLAVDCAEQVRLVVEYYTVRWMVEVFFRTLKSGCRVEERRFETLEALLPCVATYLIVAWRTLFVCRLGRALPEISCEAIFEPAEWKSVYSVVHRKPTPAQPPTLQQMVRMVAQLGGYVNRKRADEPGPQTVWLGLQRLQDISLCWEVFGPGAKRVGKDV
jgi:Transposase Tn5 dimerisation domain/Transposase DNA-binding/Transposase DDE domain